MNLPAMNRQIAELTARVTALSNIRIEGYNRKSSNSGIAFARGTHNTDANWRDKTVVIVVKPVEGDNTLKVREARYKNLPPAPCTGDGDAATCYYEWYGDIFDAYPPLGVKPIAYDGDENTTAVTTPPKLTTKFYRCHRENDVWMVDPPATAGDSSDLCLVHSSILANGNWVGNLFIRVVHVKPHATLLGQYVTAESAPLGYSVLKCWPGTDDRDWQHYKSTTGTAPTFTPLPNAVYLKTLMWKGVEYITPEVAIFTDTPNPALPAGDC